ncbi:hypothetical protein M569_05874, partial [Genlisea aurea]
NVPDLSSSSLIFEDIALTVHFPALSHVDSYKKLSMTDKLYHIDLCGISCTDQNCFLSFGLQFRSTELVSDGKVMKLSVRSENFNGTLKLSGEDSLRTWPLFKLSKICVDAEIFNGEGENVSMIVFIRCDTVDLSLSNHLKLFSQFKWYDDESRKSSFKFSFEGINIKMHLRKVSLLLTDCEWMSNGPLLDFIVRNTILDSYITEDGLEGSFCSDTQVNYYSVEKVLWEPLLEPCMIQLSISRKRGESSLLSGDIVTDINLESKTYLNMNVNESIIEVVTRTIEMMKDALIFMEARNPEMSNPSVIRNSEIRRYAPYMLQNLTTLPLVFNVCQKQLGSDDLNVFPSTGVTDIGSSTVIYINESPEELLFRYRPIQSSDRLNDKQLLESKHRHVTFQIEGSSLPSPPISMDLVGRRYFEVEFSKSSHLSEVHSDENHFKTSRKVDGDSGFNGNKGFVVPVVIDVSVQKFTKLIRLYSTVVILNATKVVLEVKLDIPFGLSSKVLGPIHSGQEFPLPLHLAEVGCIRWRPLGDSYLWSEACNISSIISRDIKIGNFRSLVCYPSHPSNEAFRCCASVNDQCLPPLGTLRSTYFPCDVEGNKHVISHGLSSNISNIPSNRFLYQVVFTSPLVVKNYLMKPIFATFEVAGLIRTVSLSQVETFFHQFDSSSDLSITFKINGFKLSTLKYPRAESFCDKAKFSGTKFSI